MTTYFVSQDHSLCHVEEVAQLLGTDPATGLRSEEATRRLVQDGPNELRAAKVKPLWRRILTQFQDPLVYLGLPAALTHFGAKHTNSRRFEI